MDKEKQERIEKAAKAAYEFQCRDDVCSRSTLAGLAEVFDFIPECLVTASASLCGGTGSASGSCGAYCAGLLAVGLKYNASIAQEQAAPDDDVFGATTAPRFSEFRDRFKSQFGTVLCPEIHKKLFGKAYQLDTPEGQQAFFKLEGHVERCGTVVAAAARLAAEMILEGEDQQ